jgi:hypothetical protein
MMLSELMAQRIVTSRKPSVVQGYYPKHSEFVATLRGECEVHGFDFKEALAEYKDSSLRRILTDSAYKRFPTGLNRNVTAEVNQTQRTDTSYMTRAPLAYGFLVNPARASAYMVQWVENKAENIVSTDLQPPHTWLRHANRMPGDVIPHNLRLGFKTEFWRTDITKVEPHKVESKIARSFGAEGELVDVFSVPMTTASNQLSGLFDVLPLSAYAAHLRPSVQDAISAQWLFNEFSLRVDKLSAPGREWTNSKAVYEFTAKIDIATSHTAYAIARREWGSDYPLSWSIFGEYLNLTVDDVRRAALTDAVPSQVFRLMTEGLSYQEAVMVSGSGVDDGLFDSLRAA